MQHFLSYPSVLLYIPFSLSLFQSIINTASFVLPVSNLVLKRSIFLGYCMDCASLCFSLLVSCSTTSIITALFCFPDHSCLYPLPVIGHSVLRENFPPSVKPKCMPSTSPTHPGNVSSSVCDAGSSLSSAHRSVWDVLCRYVAYSSNMVPLTPEL